MVTLTTEVEPEDGDVAEVRTKTISLTLCENLDSLVCGIKERDSQAFSELDVVLRPFLIPMLVRFLRNEYDSDELFNDVLLEIWVKIDAFDPRKGKFLGWVITMSRRRAIDRIRCSEARCARYQRFGLKENCEWDGGRGRSDQEWRAPYNTDRHERLHKLLANKTIPEAQRECLSLYYLKDLSQREIAAHLGIPLGTVKTRLELGFDKISRLVRFDPMFSCCE